MLAPEIFDAGTTNWRVEQQAVREGQLERILAGNQGHKKHS